MAKRAVNIQERIEKLLAGAGANPDGPTLNTQQLQGYVDTLNRLEYELDQAKLALKRATQARDEGLLAAQEAVIKAELAVKAHYGPRSPKVKEYVLPSARRRTKKTPAA